MKDLIKEYIIQNNLFEKGDKVLLALSGGPDSTCLLNLFYWLQIDFGIAHCNFKLRGEESDEDELFVKEQAKKFNLKTYFKTFKTIQYANDNKISIEMAARELRYEWLYELIKKEKYSYIVVAHNQDDIIETFFINLIRGTGLKGLTGIKPKNKQVIRPLLFATKKEILHYLKANNIAYRIDSSNLETIFKRNQIRHKLIPLLKEISPRLDKILINNISALNETYQFFDKAMEEQKRTVIRHEKENDLIEIKKLVQLKFPILTLFEIIKDYGFNYSHTEDIICRIHHPSGAKFYSATHILIKDRNELIISKLDKDKEIKYSIKDNATTIDTPISLQFKRLKYSTDFKINTSSNVAQLNASKIEFPLELRKWQKGDRFYPLGMHQSKKLSDYFIDAKINNIEKNKLWLLTSNQRILWVIGYRIDNRYKVESNTKEVLQISRLTE